MTNIIKKLLLTEVEVDEFFPKMSPEERTNIEVSAWNFACQEERRQTAKKDGLNG